MFSPCSIVVVRYQISIIVLLLGVWLFPPALSAQTDTLEHATLQQWAEQSWLLLLDRHGSVGGRLSERGVLQRFDDYIDDKYFFDRLTAAVHAAGGLHLVPPPKAGSAGPVAA